MGISKPEMIANQIYSNVFELQGPKFQVEI